MTLTVAGGLPFFATTVAWADPSAEVVYETSFLDGGKTTVVDLAAEPSDLDQFLSRFPPLLGSSPASAMLFLGGGAAVAKKRIMRCGQDPGPGEERRLVVETPTPLEYLYKTLDQLDFEGWQALFANPRVAEILSSDRQLSGNEIAFLFAVGSKHERFSDSQDPPIFNRLLGIAKGPQYSFEIRAHAMTIFGKMLDRVLTDPRIMNDLLQMAITKVEDNGRDARNFSATAFVLLQKGLRDIAWNTVSEQTREDWAGRLLAFVQNKGEEDYCRDRAAKSLSLLYPHVEQTTQGLIEEELKITDPDDDMFLSPGRRVALGSLSPRHAGDVVTEQLARLQGLNINQMDWQRNLQVLKDLWPYLLKTESWCLARTILGSLVDAFVCLTEKGSRADGREDYLSAVGVANILKRIFSGSENLSRSRIVSLLGDEDPTRFSRPIKHLIEEGNPGELLDWAIELLTQLALLFEDDRHGTVEYFRTLAKRESLGDRARIDVLKGLSQLLPKIAPARGADVLMDVFVRNKT